MTKFVLLLIVSSLALTGLAAAQDPAEDPAAASTPPRVLFSTTLGDFIIELEPEKTPLTVANFLEYVDSGFYEGTIFHRVIDEFMIQGGGFTQEGATLSKKETGPGVVNEAKDSSSNLRGSVAMARTNNPHSATAQFFVNTVDNKRLDHPSFDGWGYTVFGSVVSGMEVVDAIAGVRTKNVGPHGNVPVEPVVILSASRFTDELPAAPAPEAAPAAEAPSE